MVLEERMKQSTVSLKRIGAITNRILAEQELDSLLKGIMETAREFLETEGASLLLLDPITGDLVFDVASGTGDEKLTTLRVPAGEGVAGECARDQKIIIINSADDDPRIHRKVDNSIGFHTSRLMAVPLIATDELIGVLEVVNTKDGRDFGPRDARLLKYLADLAALAIRDTRRMQALQSRVEELRCVYEISESIRFHQDLDSMLQDVLESVCRVLGVRRLSVALKREGETSLILEKTMGFTVSPEEKWIDPEKGVIGLVYRTGKALMIQNSERDLPFVPEFSDRYETSSFLSVPIAQEKEILGVFSVADRLDGRPFDQFELQVVSTVASRLGDALVRLEAHRKAKEIEDYRRDIRMAAQIQKNSLPLIPDRIAGIPVATHYEACREVGGDFYDVHYHTDNRISFVIADVSGKGVPAALFMEYSKTLLASQIPRNLDPVTTLKRTNREILANSRMGLFVTVMILQLEREYKRIRIGSAGHNRQVLYRQATGEIEILSTKGPPLGLFENAEYHELLLGYEPGDSLYLYTDGILETEESESGEFWGDERFFAFVKENASLAPQEFTEKLFETLDAFRGQRDFSDDVTFLTLKL